MRRNFKRNLPPAAKIEQHTEKDLALMMWEKYLRPVDRPDHEGFDATVVISGDTGMGKSELAIMLQLSLSKITGIPFHIEKNVVYTREQLEEAIRTLPRYSGIVVDEAVNVLFSRDDYKNSTIIKILEACRSRNLAICFCLPDFSAMDPKARNSRIRYWIDIADVGLGLEFIRKRKVSPRAQDTDPWDSEAFRRILYLHHGDYSRHPNFMGLIRWSRMPAELRAEYNEHKHASELLSDDKAVTVSDDVASFIRWLKEKGHYDDWRGLQSRAAEYLGVNPATISQRTKG